MGERGMEKRLHFSILYFVAVFLLMLVVQNYFFKSPVENISYAEFRRLAGNKKVDNLVISADQISGVLKPGAAEIINGMRRDTTGNTMFGKAKDKNYTFLTTRLDDPNLVHVLDSNDIQYSARKANTWLPTLLSWVVPALIVLGIWTFLMGRLGRTMQGGFMSAGKSRAKIYV